MHESAADDSIMERVGEIAPQPARRDRNADGSAGDGASAGVAPVVSSIAQTLVGSGPPEVTDDANAQTDAEKVAAQRKQWGLADEIKRQDDIAKGLLPVCIAGTVAASSVAAAPGVGQFRPLFVCVAVGLVAPGICGLMSLSTVPYTRRATDMGPVAALDYKLKFNSAALVLLFVVVYAGAIAAGLVGWFD